MKSFDELHNLKRLLHKHDVSLSNWVELSQRGFSGARIYRQHNREGASYILKVTSADFDWIMRATSDSKCREAILANARIRHDRIGSPAIGSAQDSSVFSILMQDISECLLSNERVTKDQLQTILLGASHLHSLPPPAGVDVPWCTIEDRLTLFMPNPEKLVSFRIANDILAGWELFFDYAPKNIGDTVRSLFNDLGPLKRALDQLPNCFLHGDLKLDNIGISSDGTVSLIDWSMSMLAPAAIDLGWFMAMNSRASPISLDDVLMYYTSCGVIERRLHDRHHALTILCGLMLRGWRKALDAKAGDPAELHWWCERASSATKIL
ncbi:MULTISPECIES: phosphotransferase family protein [unclassified Neorhizobium]|uniref:phosphotransferase family protein n=1 Tax=unclassified Neorhizobium TaxID=2629175 RepID=UPI001FF24076|nr:MULTISPECIES: aminoglycoside phosphotransferase family protein [unclassified Neorhizobium]MCJ9674139.1 aminoglycoside phosphotransferase family protein [Neorhizobium sp. SHOUNA12B]MCJ9748912.1 aminoglycoside phosphotransferase family protein [Neorhizobium sp. SHOUNA12A]